MYVTMQTAHLMDIQKSNYVVKVPLLCTGKLLLHILARLSFKVSNNYIWSVEKGFNAD